VSSRERTTVEQRWVLGLTSIGSVMVALDVLVVAAALTTIRQDLGAVLQYGIHPGLGRLRRTVVARRTCRTRDSRTA
jgi:hypothetical protein